MNPSDQVTLADQQADPNSPLFSAKSFEELGLYVDFMTYFISTCLDAAFASDPELLRGIYDMRFSKPSKIQERALPLLLRNPYENFFAPYSIVAL